MPKYGPFLQRQPNKSNKIRILTKLPRSVATDKRRFHIGIENYKQKITTIFKKQEESMMEVHFYTGKRVSFLRSIMPQVAQLTLSVALALFFLLALIAE
ncbi:MAG: hypothetical protein OXD33_03805 [Rhodobacteraceae bacterium]|nr:hypothetical protein [Paracoccaceae bacterium]